MVGIKQDIVFGINRIRTEFTDEIGNYRSGVGTGFWLAEGNKRMFVTNKHNVNPEMLFQKQEYKLFSVEIELRHTEPNDENDPQSRNAFCNTEFVRVQNLENSLKISRYADCAILIDPEFNIDGFEPLVLPEKYFLADDTFINKKVHLMDSMSFIGFPGDGEEEWFDTEWNLPVARNATIASLPWKRFIHNSIKTDDVILVSGLSFSGSSGSPVFLHQKGIEPDLNPYASPNPPPLEDNYVPPAIIGIMTGHWRERENIPAMFRHSGLSYFTSSRSILGLINTHPM